MANSTTRNIEQELNNEELGQASGGTSRQSPNPRVYAPEPKADPQSLV